MRSNTFPRGIKAATAGLLLAVLAAGALCAWWMVSKADREMRAALFRQAQQVAQGLNIRHLRALTGTSADVLKIDDRGLPTEVTFTFDHSLDDALYQWVCWNPGRARYEAFTPPQAGEEMRVVGPFVR